MAIKLISEQLNGLMLFEPDVFEDNRGFFMESFRADELSGFGINEDFVQDNHSRSSHGVLRGMHFQWDKPQGKLIRLTLGSAYVVEVDIRHNSPTFGNWAGFELSAVNKQILWVPPGFANGFTVTDQWAEMQYKCTAYWNKDGENSILWKDPSIGIDWNNPDPVMSEKDKNALTLQQWLEMPQSKSLRI